MRAIFDRLNRRLAALEREANIAGPQLTIEKHGVLELVKWGRTIVKILRGCSMDDL